ncbi:hypothetical protein NUSPORA_01134 [Nucleospora cyclopteri]
MFEFIGNFFSAIGEFISGLFESMWTGIFSIVALIGIIIIIVVLIKNYSKSRQVETVEVDTNKVNIDEEHKANKKV